MLNMKLFTLLAAALFVLAGSAAVAVADAEAPSKCQHYGAPHAVSTVIVNIVSTTTIAFIQMCTNASTPPPPRSETVWNPPKPTPRPSITAVLLPTVSVASSGVSGALSIATLSDSSTRTESSAPETSAAPPSTTTTTAHHPVPSTDGAVASTMANGAMVLGAGALAFAIAV
ncbi:hypothetical protein EJ05DRAFT_535728 [Pseudovirgaria hyperparasitica]|uniref:GPI anchored protein n=1 Tax=Pseudovirgaria hyperparasitica TaxID=470096 RepID=A0A6A6WFJ8_9PEZI|nr:uncharacterized protein EJ05DRAFT_535728 [Pseudovirgaria hyperparasitica]KAF2760824.1 hypothetical protein EJ05DRAFT_535728 [Pseudovirgaria hyperparasitica]